MMDYIVDELKMDSSNGSNFKICFDEEITLEHAVGKLSALLSSFFNKPESQYIQDEREYGFIDLKIGDLTIQDYRIVSGCMRIDGMNHDIYRVTENNIDFSELEQIYLFLEK